MTILIYTKKYKLRFIRYLDFTVVGLIIGQSIGRWGNFANQEVYGMEVTNPALQWFPFAVYIEKEAAWHYAFFFYESMVTFTAAVLLFINAWKNPYKPNGVNTACYFITYGLVRSIMEPLRDPQYILGSGGIQWSFVFSLCLLIGGLGALFFILFRNKCKEGKLFGSANGDPYGITDFIGDSKTEIPYRTKINMMCKIYPEKYEEKPVKEKKK